MYIQFGNSKASQKCLKQRKHFYLFTVQAITGNYGILLVNMVTMIQFYNSNYIKVYPSFESPLNQKQHNLMADRQTLYFVKILFEIVFYA